MIFGHVRLDMPLPLILQLTRRMNIHDEPLHLAVVAHRDAGVALANSRKPVDLVARNFVATSSDAFDGNCITTERGYEPVVFFRLAGRARDERDDQEGRVSHGRKAYGA